MSTTMKAVVFHEYGGPNVLSIAHIEKPTPKEREVLISIRATSVTAEDPKMRAFNHPLLLKFPVGLMFGFSKPRNPVPGMEFSGIIEAVGSKVTEYSAGDAVFGYTGLGFGAYATYKCMPSQGLFHTKPKNLSFEESACMVNGALTALTYLRKKGKVGKGDTVLIYGASGSVGTAAVQLSKYFGAHVTGVCSTKNVTLVKSLGADEVIDYLKEDFTQRQGKYDLIFDTIGKTSWSACKHILNPKGKYLLTEFGMSEIIKALYYALFGKKKIIITSSNFYWKREDLAFFKMMAEQGHFRSVVDTIYPIEKIAEAHQYVELGHKVGNVAISVSQD